MSVPRLPTASDFAGITTSIVPNPESPRVPANVLVLLHGLGDSEAPFANLGRQLNLPHTCVVAVRAAQPLPFGLQGFHWGDDIRLDEGGPSALDPDGGFDGATRVLREKLIHDGLVTKCGFKPRAVLLWGFGQGGMAALGVAASMSGPKDEREPQKELAGVISIGGPLPAEVAARTAKGEGKCRTPVVLLGGGDATAVTDEQVDRVKRVFEFVERTKWRRSGDGMPRNRDEMMPIMQFLARRLRAAAPDGTIEIG